MTIPIVDSVTDGSISTGTSVSVTFTNTSGDYLYAWVYDEWAGFAATTGVTYNGVALTKLRQKSWDGQRYVELWGLANPAIGSHTLSATRPSGIGFFNICALTLRGADPAGYEAINDNTSSGSSHSCSVTSITASAIVIAGAATASGVISTTSPAVSECGPGGSSVWQQILSSLATTTPGSQTVGWTQTSSWNWASIAVAHAGTPAGLPTVNLTGHFDASDISTLFKTYVSGGPNTGTPADGDTVEVWQNLVGSDILKQIGVNGLPVYRTSGMRHPCLDFTGGQRMGATTNTGTSRALSNYISAPDSTVFIAFSAESADYPLHITVAYTNNIILGDDGGYFSVGVGAENSGNTAPFKNSISIWDGGDKGTVDSAFNLNEGNVVMFRHTDGNMYVSVNDGTEASTAAGDVQSMAGQLVVANGYVVSGKPFDGKIGEIAIYNVALTGANFTNAMNYFINKWTLFGALTRAFGGGFE